MTKQSNCNFSHLLTICRLFVENINIFLSLFFFVLFNISNVLVRYKNKIESNLGDFLVRVEVGKKKN